MKIELKCVLLFFIFIQSCFTFEMEAPIEADFNIEECAVLRSDLDEGEDPWFHCENNWEYKEDRIEEGELCCLNSECGTNMCLCGKCTSM